MQLEDLKPEIRKNAKELGLKLIVLNSPEIENMAKKMAYEPMNIGTIYNDGTQGLLVQLSEKHNKYNNGVYMLHFTSEQQYVLEVIVPNNRSKDDLIRKITDQISIFVENLDTGDLDVYDFAEVYGFVIANTVVKHLAKSLYPDDKAKQHQFNMLYTSRFLAQVAQIHAGSKEIQEEAVNSDPYMFKMLIDGVSMSDLIPETEAKETQDDAEVSE